MTRENGEGNRIFATFESRRLPTGFSLSLSLSLAGFTLCDGARLEAAAISLTVQRLNRLSDASTAEV